MFDRIAHRYDLLNHLLSFGHDFIWRSAVVRYVPENSDCKLLDIATGTADQVISICKRCEIKSAIGLDMSQKMLSIGREKLSQVRLNHQITLVRGDALKIPLKSGSVDVVTITFGIRNVVNVQRALSEMLRMLRPGGRVIILEFSIPPNFLFRRLYLLYFRNILPVVGSLISGDRYAYNYLNQTVETFPYGDEFLRLLIDAGFKETNAEQLTCGIATIYTAAA
jgi:demethylmenaquinone methyltransferase / 2-methoxy-6-polyprenyl-1,4-benzoquinol methylase